MTRRGCQEIAKTIFDIDISLGSVCALHQEVSESLATAHAQVQQALPEQPVLNIDETGCTSQGNRRWLWLLSTRLLRIFMSLHLGERRSLIMVGGGKSMWLLRSLSPDSIGPCLDEGVGSRLCLTGEQREWYAQNAAKMWR